MRDPEKQQAAQRRYAQSEKGRTTRRRYRQSERGQTLLQRYAQSDKGRTRQKCYRQSNKGRTTVRANNWRRRGIDPVLAELWWTAGFCFVCGATERLVVDHQHGNPVPRGLLCHRCNTALGLVYDDPVRLRVLADYLEGKPCVVTCAAPPRAMF